MQYLLPRDIARDTVNFIHIFGWKQKFHLQLSKLKSAILQLNTHYYRNCYNESANKTNYMEFIFKDECPLNSSDLIPLDYHVWTAMLRYTNVTQQSRSTLTELKTVLQAIWADLPQDPI